MCFTLGKSYPYVLFRELLKAIMFTALHSSYKPTHEELLFIFIFPFINLNNFINLKIYLKLIKLAWSVPLIFNWNTTVRFIHPFYTEPFISLPSCLLIYCCSWRVSKGNFYPFSVPDTGIQHSTKQTSVSDLMEFRLSQYFISKGNYLQW